MASSQLGFAQRLETYRASKTVLAWCCAFTVAATILVGFTWGGWMTGGSATRMADTAAEGARARLAAEICTAQFKGNPDAAGQLAALSKLESWDRADFIRKGGWVNLPGIKEPISGAADLCAQELVSAKS